MRSVFSALSFWLVIAATAVPLVPAEAQPDAGRGTKHVLVLYSTRRDAPMSSVGDRELPALLEQGLKQDLLFYSEYIDLGRFPEPNYLAAFSDFLRVKYAGQRMDLVIAIQDAAVDFLARYQSQVFPDIPAVFLAISPPAEPLPNATGVIAGIDLASTLTLALELQPDLRNVFVVSGAGAPGKRYEALARSQLRRFEATLDVTYLAGLAAKDLETRLTTLPRGSIVYYLVVYVDATGEQFSPARYLERLASIANAPTYSWVDTAMGRGIVGGNLLDSRAMMTAVSELALRVLNGERADGIPVSAPNLNVGQVDWRQLRRWRIDEDRVPEGTAVLFRQLSVFEEYRTYILGAVTVVVLQSILIGGLLIERQRRQRAERSLRASHEQVQRLAGRLINAQEAERARIARELHDDIGQHMALLTMDLELLGRAGPETNALAGEALTRTRSITGSVRALSHRLHPVTLRLIGLMPALNALRNELTNAEFVIDLTSDDLPPVIPSDVTLCLFRIVQEGLQNALKYSRARKVSIHLSGRGEGLAMEIADDGVGFDVEEVWGKGLGLISMAERVEAIGGRFEIRSRPGSGTRVHVSVPRLAVNQEQAVV